MLDITRVLYKYKQYLLIALASMVVFILSSKYDFLEILVAFSRNHEQYEIDESVSVVIFLVVVLAYLFMRRTQELSKQEKILQKRNKELESALKKIKRLEGILPICASCKKIRDENDTWHQMESYIDNHSEASFSHGLCPECEKEFYDED